MTASGSPPKVVTIWRLADQEPMARLLRLLFERPTTSTSEGKGGGGRAA